MWLLLFSDVGDDVTLTLDKWTRALQMVYKENVFVCLLSSSRGTNIRSLPVFKPAGSPAANHDAELYAPYRTPPRLPSSTTNSSSCHSSPSSRYGPILQNDDPGPPHTPHSPTWPPASSQNSKATNKSYFVPVRLSLSVETLQVNLYQSQLRPGLQYL